MAGKKITITEPTFKRIVVMYREEVEMGVGMQEGSRELGMASPTKQERAAHDSSAQQQSTVQGEAHKVSLLRLKAFADVPMADMTAIFPHTEVQLTLSFKFLATSIAAVAACLQLLRKFLNSGGGRAAAMAHVVEDTVEAVVEGAVDVAEELLEDAGELLEEVTESAAATTALLVTVAMIGSKMVQLYTSMQNQKEEVRSIVTRQVYSQMADAERGVVLDLAHSSHEQEVKEALLGYFVLWRQQHQSAYPMAQVRKQGKGTKWGQGLALQGGGSTKERADELCEELLLRHFDLKVDFEVEDALEKLTRDGLVDMLPNGTYRARPMMQALEVLDDTWDAIFADDEDQPRDQNQDSIGGEGPC
jgi:hypothetical protein